MGALEVDASTVSVGPLDGPSMFYQGFGLPDIRSAPFAKDGFRPGQQAAFLNSNDVLVLDQIPQARTTTMISAAQIQTAGVSVALATVQAAGVASVATIAVGVPIIPLGTTIATFANIAIDFGFTTGTTIANSTVVAVVDNRLFSLGQWIIIGGAGNTAATRSHITQVVNIATANLTGININPAAITAISSAPIGQANLFGSDLLPAGSQFGPATASANAHSFGGAFQAGLAKIYNPREMLSRNIALNMNSSALQTALISGWDVWGAPMTEIISATATTFAGKKAFKYLSSITLGSTTGQTGSFGLGDTFGLPLRADYWEQAYVMWNGASAANSNGFTGALATTSSTATADVRGTVQISTAVVTGVLATAVSGVASNGTGRLSVTIGLTPIQSVFGTPINPAPVFGTAQGTATA